MAKWEHDPYPGDVFCLRCQAWVEPTEQNVGFGSYEYGSEKGVHNVYIWVCPICNYQDYTPNPRQCRQCNQYFREVVETDYGDYCEACLPEEDDER